MDWKSTYFKFYLCSFLYKNRWTRKLIKNYVICPKCPFLQSNSLKSLELRVYLEQVYQWSQASPICSSKLAQCFMKNGICNVFQAFLTKIVKPPKKGFNAQIFILRHSLHIGYYLGVILWYCTDCVLIRSIPQNLLRKNVQQILRKRRWVLMRNRPNNLRWSVTQLNLLCLHLSKSCGMTCINTKYVKFRWTKFRTKVQ